MIDILDTLRDRGLDIVEGRRGAYTSDGDRDHIYVSIKAGPSPSAEDAARLWLQVFDAAFQSPTSGTLYWRPGRLPGFPEVKELTAKRAGQQSDAGTDDAVAPGWYAYGRCVVVPK